MEEPEDEELVKARESSEKRYDYATKFLKANLKEPNEMIDACAQCPDKDNFMKQRKKRKERNLRMNIQIFGES